MVWYIDPGTGSMLFSVFIGLAATMYFAFRGLAIKLKTRLGARGAAKADAARVPYVIYNEGMQYVDFFIGTVEEFEKRGLPLLYLTSAKQDPVLARSWRHVKAEYIGEGNRAFARLNFLNADVVLMTTPGLDVYQLKRSKTVGCYAHIVHAPSDATGYRLFGIDFYDAVLLTGSYQAKDLRYLEAKRHLRPKDLVVVGCPYLDVLQKKALALPKEQGHTFTVLVSPSWGPSALLSKYGERLLDPLVDSGMEVIVRPHPQSRTSEKELLERLEKRYEGRKNVSWDFRPENIVSLSLSDVMISDFSGIIFDYTFLFDRPVMYVPSTMDKGPYDASCVDHEMWQFESLEKFGIKLREEDFPRIATVVRQASDSEVLRAARHEAKREAWEHQGESAERICDFLVSAASALARKKSA